MISRNYYEEGSENANANILKLNTEEHLIFDEFTEMVSSYEAGQINNGNVIFLDAPGGMGKTFLIKTILS